MLASPTQTVLLTNQIFSRVKLPIFLLLFSTVQLATYRYTHQTLRRAKSFSHSCSCENSTVCDSPIEIQPGRTSFSDSCLVVSCQSSRIASATFHAFHCITSPSPSRHSSVEVSKERLAHWGHNHCRASALNLPRGASTCEFPVFRILFALVYVCLRLPFHGHLSLPFIGTALPGADPPNRPMWW